MTVIRVGQLNAGEDGAGGGEAGDGAAPPEFISISDELSDVSSGDDASAAAAAAAAATAAAEGGGDAGEGAVATPVGIFTEFQTLVTKNSPDFKIPDEVLKGDPMAQLDYMAQTFTSIGKTQASEDPFIKEYNEAIAGGASKEDFLSHYKTIEMELALPSKEFMTNHLKAKNGVSDKNPTGWTDEEITEEINNMSRVALDQKVETLKDVKRETASQDVKNIGSKTQAQTLADIDKKNVGLVEQTTQLFTEMADVKDIGGIPHTKEMQERFKPVFDKLTKVNPNGRTEIKDLLADNKNLYKVAMFLMAEEQGLFSKANAEFKQQFAADFLNKKVKVNPRSEEGITSTVAIPTPEDMV